MRRTEAAPLGARQAEVVEACFRENRRLVARAAACKKATPAELKVRGAGVVRGG